MLMPIDKLWGKATTMEGFPTFMDTPEGNIFLVDECKVVHVGQHSTCYVPWGWLPLTVFVSRKASDPGWAHVWAMPLMMESLASRVSTRTSQAVRSFSEEFLKGQASRLTSFGPRLAMWTAFFF